ncbi:MAG: sigma-54 dependent transcriptional regulator [Gemmatimonadales bacterium]
MGRRVLVVDDEEGIREAIRQVLEYEGIEIETASSGANGLKAYAQFHPHLVFLDVKMGGMDGLETLRALRELDPRAVIVMISGHGTIETAVESTQLGAYDFLEKPLDTDRLLLILRNVFEKVELESEFERLQGTVGRQHEIIGKTPSIREVLELIEKVAPTNARVLITGENGSGKELVARAIHRGSPRVGKPFVEVNCAAIPSELIESELFGHMKGSFTGAFADRAGKFEQADGGMLFLDEVGDMSAAAQAKVLRVLEGGEVTRIGATKPVSVDVRVITATNKQLEDEIVAGRFREDLFYRLNVVPIEVPPLRSRRDDIPLLVDKFASDLVRSSAVGPKVFTKDAIKALQKREWPGNIRELRNTVERLLILSAGQEVQAADVLRLTAGATDMAAGNLAACQTFDEFKETAERAFLEAKLAANGWNVSETARKLEMPRSNLYKKIEKYGLERG